MDLIDKRDEVLRTFIEYGITENTENDLTKKDLADCAEKIVEKLILSGVGQQRELLIDFSVKTHGNLLFGWKKEDSKKLVNEYQKGNL